MKLFIQRSVPAYFKTPLQNYNGMKGFFPRIRTVHGSGKVRALDRLSLVALKTQAADIKSETDIISARPEPAGGHRR